MAKKKTKLDKMSKKERTSLAYALATNLAKHGKPQSPTNERKLTKGEEKKKEKHVMKFKKSFDLEEQEFSKKYDDNPAIKGKQSELPDALQKAIIKKTDGKIDEGVLMSLAQQIMKDRDLKPKSKVKTNQEELPKNYNFMTGKFTEKLDPVGKEDADINNDGKVDKTDDYLKNRRKAVSKAIKEEALQLVHVYDKDGKMYGTGSVEKVEGDKTVVRFDGSTVKRFPSDRVKPVKEAVSKAIQKEGDLDLGHQDNEPHMLKKDLYRIAKYASELYEMVNQFDIEGQEVDFPHWWQSKVIKAKSMLVSAKHYLDGELTVPQIDATLEEEEKEYKVLSTKELNRLAALPPTHPSHKKDRRYKRLTKKK